MRLVETESGTATKPGQGSAQHKTAAMFCLLPALRPAQAGVAAPAGSAPLVESATESAPRDKGADWELNSHAARTLNTRGKQCKLAKIVTKTAAALDSTSGALPFSDDLVATS